MLTDLLLSHVVRDIVAAMKQYLARVWTEPPGQSDLNPFVDVSRRFATLLAARDWAEANVRLQPHATGGATVWEEEGDDARIVWERKI